MDAEHWQRLSPLLDALFELEPEARALRLRELREENGALADELETLLALDDADFLCEPLLAPLAGLRAGSEVGPYRLDGMLGEGGMGQVWLASRADGLYQRRVALKLLRPGLADTNLRLRFNRERQILARLAHPNIARLLDAGVSSDGLPYLALEYVDGKPITDYCREHNTPLETRLRMFQQICDAVSHAHANLIVHRDLKPSNILVTPAGDVRLLDFGIGKLLDSEAPAPERTRTGVRAFTLHYAAPEQIRGEPVTTMTDVYSLGVVLYEVLTGHKPYRLKRQSDAAWEEAILGVDPLRPSQTVLRGSEDSTTDHGRTDHGMTDHGATDYSRTDHSRTDPATLRRISRALAGDLDNIVLKALSKRPEQRYASVEALSQDLQRYLGGRAVQARPQSVRYRLGKYLRRHRWAVTTGVLMTLVLASAFAIVAWQAREAVAEAGRAQAMQDFMIGLFENAGGAHDGTPLELRPWLDAALERGSRELTQQPRARAELLGVVARVRIGVGDYQQARALLERQATIIGLVDVPTSLQLESLTQRGRVLRLLGDPRGCIALMQPMLRMVQREQAHLPSQASEFYSQLGRCRRNNGEHQSARQLFGRSLALRHAIAGDSVGEIESLMDLAGVQADQGQWRTALQGFQSARVLLRREVGDRHSLQVEIGRNLGNLHHSLGQNRIAETELRTALAVALDINGPQHPATLAVRRQLATVLVDQGQFAAAEAELGETHTVLVERLGADHPDLAVSYSRLGLVQWERGDIDAATGSLHQAVKITRGSDDAARIGEALFDLASVLHAAGRDRQALPLLREAQTLRVRAHGAEHVLVGDTKRLLGEVMFASNDRAAGLAHLQQALQLTRAGYGEGHPNTRRGELALAYHRGLAGDSTTQPQLDALAGLSDGDRAQRSIAWLARAYRARLRCDGPLREQAGAELAALSGQLARTQPDGGVLPREIASLRDACAMNQVAASRIAAP
ncbi:MAG: protein kinase [Pseudomonadota bacterium]|nr:protein kinase [Pseudomonadota bacterium]